MARPASSTLTPAELRVMRVLWERGPSTGSTVRRAVGETGVELAESTVRTMLGILVEKGYVAADRRNRSHVYRALVSEREARQEALRDLVSRFFGGSREELALALVRDERVGSQELARLQRIIQEGG